MSVLIVPRIAIIPRPCRGIHAAATDLAYDEVVKASRAWAEVEENDA